MFARHALVLSLIAAAGSSVHAQVLKDTQWQGWLDAGKATELERAAQDRLKSQPGDAQAAVAFALAVVEDGSPAKLEAALPPLQTCVDKTPQAVCHYGLGRVYGQQAMTASMFKMASLAGKTKEQFIKAVELDPMLYDARSGLVQFYLMAPGIAGGSVSKAKELAQQSEAKQPEQAKLLRSLIATNQEDYAGAEKELLSVKVGDDKGLQRELRGGWMQLGSTLIQAKNWNKARAAFEVVQRDFPTYAGGPYGMARVQIEQGQFDEAIRLLERARGLENAESFPIDHRLGVALMGKGDKAGAKTALERFLTNKRARPGNLEDAKKRLAELG